MPIDKVTDAMLVNPVSADRLSMGIFNIKDYGAKGDNVTDDTQAIRDAISAINSNGGGVLYIPAGRYRTSSSVDIVENMHVQGEGMFQSVIKRTDDSTDNLIFSKTSPLEFRTRISFDSLTLEGNWDIIRREASTNGMVTGRSMMEVSFSNVRFMHGTGMGININRCLRVTVHNCRFLYICRDMCAVWACPQTIITNNIFKGNDDDVISLSNESEYGTLDGENIKNQLIIANNITEDTGSIRIQQAKIAIIHSNTITRCKGASAIYIGSNNAGWKRLSNPHSVIITQNNIIDLIDRTVSVDPADGLSPTPNFRVAIKIEGLHPKARDGQTTISGEIDPSTGEVFDPYGGYYEHSQYDNSGQVRRLEGILVSDNVVKRTLPAVNNYNDWGFGTVFTRFSSDSFAPDGFANPTVTNEMLKVNGIRLEGSLRTISVKGNMFAGGGDYGIWGISSLVGDAAFDGTDRNLQWDNFLIENNDFYDFSDVGILLSNISDSLYQDIIIRQNTFNGDPFIKDEGRGPEPTVENPNPAKDGSWRSKNNLIGIDAENVQGVSIIENTFKNLSLPYLGGGGNTAITFSRNIFVGEPASDISYNNLDTRNKGLGTFPSELQNTNSLLIRENSDPTSPDYRKQLPRAATEVGGSEPPTEGFYFRGQIIWSRFGSNGVIGFRRRTTSDRNDSNLDWETIRVEPDPLLSTTFEISSKAELTLGFDTGSSDFRSVMHVGGTDALWVIDNNPPLSGFYYLYSTGAYQSQSTDLAAATSNLFVFSRDAHFEGNELRWICGNEGAWLFNAQWQYTGTRITISGRENSTYSGITKINDVYYLTLSISSDRVYLISDAASGYSQITPTASPIILPRPAEVESAQIVGIDRTLDGKLLVYTDIGKFYAYTIEGSGVTTQFTNPELLADVTPAFGGDTNISVTGAVLRSAGFTNSAGSTYAENHGIEGTTILVLLSNGTAKEFRRDLV